MHPASFPTSHFAHAKNAFFLDGIGIANLVTCQKDFEMNFFKKNIVDFDPANSPLSHGEVKCYYLSRIAVKLAAGVQEE